MERKSFTFNPRGTCLFGSWNNPKSVCVFDYWSIYHFYFTGLVYLIVHYILNIQSIKGSSILLCLITLIHIMEEYLGNTTRKSMEGIVIDYIAPIFDPKIKPELRGIDNDFLQNSIGDVFAGVLSSGFVAWYSARNNYKKLPWWYICFLPIIIFMLFQKSKMLHDPITSFQI